MLGHAAHPDQPSHARVVRATLVFVGVALLWAIVWLALPGFLGGTWLAVLALALLGMVAATALHGPTRMVLRAQVSAGGGAALWVRWLLAGGAGGGVGLGLAVAVPGGLLLVCVGLVAGIPQWMVLRRYLQGARWWIAVTATSFPLGALLGLEFLYVAGPLGPLAGGFVIGAAQWLILRYRNDLPRAGWWVVASMAGWTVDCWVVVFAGDLAFPPDLKSLPLGALLAAGFAVGAAGGLAYGAVTAPALVALLHRRAADATGPMDAAGQPGPPAR